jgi:hypothetical protein
VYADGEPQIIARPIQWQPKSARKIAFWSMPFERGGFASGDEMCQAFLRALDIILAHRTRVIQRRGILAYSFRCEYEVDGKWEHLASVAWSRFAGVGFVAGAERETVFAAEPLAGAVWTHN